MKDTRASASVHSESHMSPSHRACRRAALGPLINPHTTHRGGEMCRWAREVFASLQESVPWHHLVLCQTCKYPGCHRVNHQKPAAKTHGAAVALLGTGSALSPCAVTLWLHIKLAYTSLEDSLPVFTRPAERTGRRWAGS